MDLKETLEFCLISQQNFRNKSKTSRNALSKFWRFFQTREDYAYFERVFPIIVVWMKILDLVNSFVIDSRQRVLVYRDLCAWIHVLGSCSKNREEMICVCQQKIEDLLFIHFLKMTDIFEDRPGRFFQRNFKNLRRLFEIKTQRLWNTNHG